jgi:cytochrome P450
MPGKPTVRQTLMVSLFVDDNSDHISLTRAMLHDENIYPDPFVFKPERFLTEDGLSIRKDVKDPGFAFWGFGRRCPTQSWISCNFERLISFLDTRICPGRYMAASSLWITIASLIAAFDITKSDATGGLDHEYGPGILR